jgi:hypothetical protein
VKYQKLNSWKYRVVEAFSHSSNVFEDITSEYGSIKKDGTITINKDYCWDGGSGPAIDTKNSQDGSCLHDYLYFLFREGLLDPTKYRDIADRLLESVNIEKGMSKMRAGWWYWAVKSFAKRSTVKSKKESNPIIET